MEEGKTYPSLGYPWLQSVLNWSIVHLVVVSMMVQVVLVVGGAVRYRNGSLSLNFIIWVCYMGADFVATSALGSMIHYKTREIVYAIWASVVMVHLGGPDTITAYSVPDSNLWLRHCFKMVYQGSVAAYVVYVSAVQGGAEIEWNLLGAACLIFIVGITKNGERAWALLLASPPQIVSSVQPIHNYMKIEHALGLQIDEHIPDDEIADVDKFRRLHENKVDKNTVDYQYLVVGEECFHEDDDNGDWSESVVTIKDVWEHEGEVVTDNYLLCVAHALFKMYKRRFANLQFHEGPLKKTERFFREWRFNKIQAFNILEIELKFVYDYLFSKSSGTAFSGWGVGMRVVNIFLLGFCWFLIVQVLQGTQDVLYGQRIVTYILMCVALWLEVFQLARIILSDWSMLWLICAKIRQSRNLSERWWANCTAKLIQGVAKVVERVRKKVGGKYWQNQISQLCVIETCFSVANSYNYRLIRKVLGFCPFQEFIMGEYIRAITVWHIKKEFVDDHSKDRVLDNLKYLAMDARSQLSEIKQGFKALEEGVGYEHLILAWHMVTTIMEKLEDESQIKDDDVKRNIGFCSRMSKYFAYLLVMCPEILPVEGDSAKIVYMEVFSKTISKIDENKNATFHDFCKNFKDSDWDRGSVVLRMAKSLVIESLEDSVEWRWHKWALNWLIMLCMCAVYDKVEVHGDRITVGGEFLTQVWVLCGHMGMTEESYFSTAIKRDPFLS